MATFEDYVKFKINKPEAKREFRTIEIFHPKFSKTFRLVQDFDQYDAFLESTAPRQPGQLITFEPFSGKIVEPAERNDGDLSLQVDIGDLKGEIQDELDMIDGVDWLTPIEIIYRKYWSDDNTAPAVNPFYLFANSPSFEESDGEIPVNASFTAQDSDLSQKSAGSLYTTTDYSGLK